MYSVTLDGEFIGYTEDKGELQSKINEYRKSGDGKTIAFVEIEKLPEYKLCLLKKGVESNDQEIFDTVASTGIPYYKYYAILDNNEEKYYVETYEEAESILTSLKEKNSMNKENVSYLLKYETELKEFTGTETAVSGIDLDIRKCNFFPSGRVAETVGYSLGTARGYLLTRWNNSVMKLRGQSVERRNVKNSFLLKKFLAVLGLHFSTRTFSGCSEWGCSPFAV